MVTPYIAGSELLQGCPSLRMRVEGSVWRNHSIHESSAISRTLDKDQMSHNMSALARKALADTQTGLHTHHFGSLIHIRG